MPRRFNVAGPCKPELHYMLPAAARVPLARRLVADFNYFVIHAPRQTGKTTSMIALAQELTASGAYVAALVSVEVGAAFNHDPGAAEFAILNNWRLALNAQMPLDLQPPAWPDAEPGTRIGAALQAWAQTAPRPLVIFIDEIDALQNETLISVLRQLRAGHNWRPTGFPAALALIGMRDVRDYKVASGGSERLNTASPFNVKTRSMTLSSFTRDEVALLYQQHTDDTGQVFPSAVIDYAFALTQGQPWLVNDLAKTVVEDILKDEPQPVTVAHLDAAKEVMIQRQDTHLDSLAERLREPRVRRVIEPILVGGSISDVPHDDIRFVVDLGLCRFDGPGGLVIANPIYHEVLPRVLAGGARDSLPHIAPAWLKPDGSLDPDKLLDAFLAFWRQHGQPLLGSVHYHEIAPHLVLMPFLHRVVNGNGSLDREYAIGTRRMDLCLRYGGPQPVTMGMELKVWRDGEPDPRDEGLAQLDKYLAGLGLDGGWLVIFDRRSGVPPIAQRTTVEAATSPQGRTIAVVRA
ncbi:ATP-binding protein [Candidatus Chloroploca asiatica]|uniref:Polyketide biosynthesis operon protein CyrO n=1 Tax=Candidatus Chloroploca asiatica TaxID=1506545 RepID=A0A2H3KKZ9_9CHLR|nr:ATP-binding protein [Candidatus Chloroploca asiatica]PDV98629.1 polyketide biosynthesis operon protein CyrO [Candidatus Chloroploca asiatica]